MAGSTGGGVRTVSNFCCCSGHGGILIVTRNRGRRNGKSARSERNQTIMAIKEDVRARSPRGTKTVTQAFFEALDAIPDSQQKAVATAALAGIRDDLKARRLK